MKDDSYRMLRRPEIRSKDGGEGPRECKVNETRRSVEGMDLVIARQAAMGWRTT